VIAVLLAAGSGCLAVPTPVVRRRWSGRRAALALRVVAEVRDLGPRVT
jgi:hypothetical protein